MANGEQASGVPVKALGSSKEVQRELERAEYAAASRFRKLNRFWTGVFSVCICAVVILAMNQVFNAGFLLPELTEALTWLGLLSEPLSRNQLVIIDTRYFYLIMVVLFPLAFLLFPAYAGAPKDRVPWYDVLLALLVTGILLYFIVNANVILDRAWEFMAPDEAKWIALLMWLLLLEIGRRTGGISIFIITLIFSFYPVYVHLMPALITGANQPLLETAAFHIYSEESLNGLPMRAFAYLVFGFLLFGVTLQFTGAGAFFINFAFSLLGHVRGGPAKVAIFSSGLMGSMSGSVITNVLTTGTLSIPAMKRVGFKPTYAGGVEACASTGGTLMPPIMGATAFIMAEFLQVSYVEVALAAAIPSILYYFGLFMQIDSYSGRHGMKGLPREELPSVWRTLKEGWYYIFAFAVLIYFLVVLHWEREGPYYATAVLLIINQFSPTHKMTWVKFKEFFVFLGRLLAELGGLLAAIGLVIGALSVTGMTGTLATDLVFMAGENTFILLVMGAITSFILGIGMTVTAAYVFLAIILAPALVQTGLDPMGVHMFMLYWAMISFITPPVAIGAFAASKLAGSTPMATGIEACKIGIVIYFIPFFFVYNPALLGYGTTLEVIEMVGTAAVGIVFVAAATQGYLVFVGTLGGNVISMIGRLTMLTGGIFMAAPTGLIGDLSLIEMLAGGAALAAIGTVVSRVGVRLFTPRSAVRA